jgi:nitrite reductase/ring-hydroxylating ferredoxin subunit
MRPMSAPSEWRLPLADLPPGRTAKFRLSCGGRTLHGFVVNHDGGCHAWVNRCPHVGTPLDLWPNEFLTDDGREVICSTHGALFDPASGRCTAGPCAGDGLTRVPLRVDGADVVVRCPGP